MDNITRNALDDQIVFKCNICDESFDNMSSKYLVHLVLRHTTSTQRKNLALLLDENDLNSEESFCMNETYYRCLITMKRVSEIIKPEIIAADEDGGRFSQEPSIRIITQLSEPYVEKVEPNSDSESNKVEEWKQNEEKQISIPSSSKSTHQCSLCQKVFTTKYTLSKHLKTMHSLTTAKRKTRTTRKPAPKFENDDDTIDGIDNTIVSRSSSPADLGQNDANAKESTPTSVHKCEICSKTFTRLKYYESHSRRHIEWNDKCRKRRETKVHLCNVCGKRYPDAYSLKMHLYVHTDDRPLRCDICGKGFVIKPTLRNHMFIHSGEKPYVCDVEGCNRAFTHSTGKRQHYNSVHSNIKRFECEHCGKPFARKTHLMEHVRNHTGERPYGCEFCGMYFKLTSTLRSHRKTHTGDRPFKCKLCNKGFIKSHNLKAHMAAKRSCVPLKTELSGTARPSQDIEQITSIQSLQPISSVVPMPVPYPHQ